MRGPGTSHDPVECRIRGSRKNAKSETADEDELNEVKISRD